MKKVSWLDLLILVSLASGCFNGEAANMPIEKSFVSKEIIKLPEPRLKSDVSLEETLQQRRSVREYSAAPLRLDEVSQLMWAGQGVTSDWGGRTAPSAGALYPLEVYLVAGMVEGIAPGVYKYQPEGHTLVKVREGDSRAKLADVSLGQAPVRDGAIDIVITAVYERTTRKYGDRGIRYVHIEAGHAAQNILLQAVALDLAAVPIGAFDDGEVREIIGAPANESPLYVIPVGRK